MDTTTQTQTDRQNEIARRTHNKARKLAQDAAGRRLPADRVSIKSTVEGYKVYYTVPRTEGFFICNLTLDLSPVEFYAYEQVYIYGS